MKLKGIKNATKISKSKQANINGGSLGEETGIGGGCFVHINSASCSAEGGCKWYNECYCGPLAPHFAPC